MGAMTDVRSLHPEDDVLCDIGGVVGYALEIAGYKKRVESLANYFRAIVHGFDELDEGIVAHAVDDVIHLEDSLSEFDLAFDEGFQRTPDHGTDGSAHARNINRQIGHRKIHHIHDALGDVDSLIADALQIGIDLCDGENE